MCTIYINNTTSFTKGEVSYIDLKVEINKSNKVSKDTINAAKKKLEETMAKVGVISSYLNENIHEYHINCNYIDSCHIKVNIN